MRDASWFALPASKMYPSIRWTTLTYVDREGLAGRMVVEEVEDGFEVRIAQCHICPKKVGHYQLDGTACPWGRILLGALTAILGASLSCSTRLTPGETCLLQLKRK